MCAVFCWHACIMLFKCPTNIWVVLQTVYDNKVYQKYHCNTISLPPSLRGAYVKSNKITAGRGTHILTSDFYLIAECPIYNRHKFFDFRILYFVGNLFFIRTSLCMVKKINHYFPKTKWRGDKTCIENVWILRILVETKRKDEI